MTISYIIRIDCSGFGRICVESVISTPTPKPDLTGVKAAARACGWRIEKHHQLCPRCSGREADVWRRDGWRRVPEATEQETT